MEVRINVKIKGDVFTGAAKAKFVTAQNAAFREAGLYLEGEVAKKTPVNLGILRKSIAHDVKGPPLARFGRVFSALEYATPVEEGQTPHWPPYLKIHSWVLRKFGLKGTKARKVAWAVSRAIAFGTTRGKSLKGHKMFSTVVKSSRVASIVTGIFRRHMKSFIVKI